MRVAWHVEGVDWKEYLVMARADRQMLNEALDEQIDRVNDAGGGNPPSKERKGML